MVETMGSSAVVGEGENLRARRSEAEWDQAWSRLQPKIQVVGECWIWTGATNGKGYGRVAFRGRNAKAYRVAWSAFNKREWPDGAHALHSCDNPPCVNPAHIRPGTNKENSADSAQKGRNAQQRKTHCPRGHAYSPENIRVPRGRRSCRACRRDRYRESGR